MTDILIRGGTVIDGTGGPGRQADVRVSGDRIAEVGPGLRRDAEHELDASGAVVTPGFVDIHTHFDPTLFWDRTCDPMPQHGVTSVLVGNCSLSLAPVRPDQRAALGRLFCYIEDLPVATFETSVPWTWQGYADYLDVLGRGGSAVNVATLVGHTALRMCVLGDESWERRSTPDEARTIAATLAECLAAGAFGMSTSLGFDEDPQKRPVPSRLADDSELGALVEVLADYEGFLQFIPAPGFGRLKADVTRVAELTRARDVLSTWINIFHDAANPDLADQLLAFALNLQTSGVRTYPQVSPRTLDIQVNWAGGMSFGKMPDAWHPMVQAPPAEKRRLLEDPGWQARARDEWDSVAWAMIPHHHPERIRLISVTRPEHRRWLGATLAELVADRGGHPADVLAQWLLDNDLTPGVVGVGVANSDPDGVAATLRHPAAVIANSDAGAHLQMMCAAGDTTLLLTRHVRDRADLTLQDAVHQLTGRPAQLFGFSDRGVVKAGAVGDLAVFALDELSWEPDVLVDDLPAGGSRLRRPAGGYRWTLVAGTVTQEQGELTGELPGRVLRR